MTKAGLILPGLLALLLAGPVAPAAGQPPPPTPTPPSPYPPGYPPGTGAPPPSYPQPPPQPEPAPSPSPSPPTLPAPPPAPAAPVMPPAVAAPGKPGQDLPGGERHQGLFLRLMLGFGYASAESDLSIEGGGHPKVQLAMGYAVFENLALFAQLKLSAFAAAGVGATYYLMPVHLFAGAALSAGILQARSDRMGSDYRASAAGPVVSLFLGKEWWVSSDWGLGLALDADGGKVTWKDELERGHDITAFTIGAALVATFN